MTEKAINEAYSTGDCELIARASGSAGLHFASYNDPKNTLYPIPKLYNALNIFDEFNIVSPEIKPIQIKLNEQIAKSPIKLQKFQNRNLFACIEIGSSGVKLGMIQYQRNSEGEYEFTVIEARSFDTKFTDYTDENLKQTIDKVNEYYKYVTTDDKYVLGPNRVFIAVSSGVMSSVGREIERMKMLTDLTEGIKKNTNNREIGILEEADEPKLTLLGVLPSSARSNKNDELYQHALIDIGTGNTKGGYFGRDKDQKIFYYFSTPWALRRLEERLQNVPIKDGKLYKEATQVVDSLRRNITSLLNSSNVQSKSNVVLNGGIFWAIAVFMKPREYFSDRLFVQMTEKDIIDFKNLVAKSDSYKKMVDSPSAFLLGIEEQDRERALKEMERVHKAFPERKMLVGAVFAEAVIQQNNDSSIAKTYRFAKQGIVGWPSGWILKNIGILEDKSQNVQTK
jgi:hypothetical protein